MSSSAPSLPAQLVLPLPRLVLRVAFAGSREIPATGLGPMTETLRRLWEILGQRLVEIAPGTPLDSGLEPLVSSFFARDRPLLRLITGLAEGADALAWQSLQMLAQARTQSFAGHLDTELAAVLPCPVADYRASRDPSHHAVFDSQVCDCAYILELDGVMAKPSPDTAIDKDRRARAYRAQSAVLLRQADILLAIADPDQPGKPGGTLETVRNALDFELPVIFIHSGTGEVRMLDSAGDLAGAFSHSPAEKWETTLPNWTTKLVADPDAAPKPPAHEHGRGKENEGVRLLREFFGDGMMPPTGRDGKRKPSRHELWWDRFAKKFKSAPAADKEPPPREKALPPYDRWRSRATALNYHYSGLYRGTFYLNYVRAVLAVGCAALTLVLLGMPRPSDGKPPTPSAGHEAATSASAPTPATAAEPLPIAAPASAGQHHAAPAEGHPLEPWWLLPALLALATAKFILVFRIYRNTHAANHGGWNEKAVDFRYLAERLRAMFYLPYVGSYQPPAAADPQYASRVVRQSAVDWLFDAIVRSVSPADSPMAQPRPFTAPDGSIRNVPVLAMKPTEAVAAFTTWVKSQEAYHKGSTEQMNAMNRWAEKWGRRLGMLVIAIVAFDIAVLSAYACELIPEPWEHRLHATAPWLVFMTALLPAAVASLNGIRFQSECRRLADRSSFMQKVLGGRNAQLAHLSKRIASAQAASATDVAAWTTETLTLGETIASDFVREVAEWSVLYGKEVPEP